MTLNVADQWPDIIAQPLTGELRLRVRGRSMWPTLQPGDEAHVAPVAAEALQPGDWIIIRAPNGPLIHRFLGFTREGELLTKGDAHRAPDPPWPQEALLGHVTAFTRRGITTAVRSHSLAERMKTMWHRVVAGIWQRRRSRRHTLSSVLLALLCLALLFHPLLAAVTLSRFGASVQADSIKVYWETASEVNMSVFYVLRSLSETGTYSRISNFIPAEGDLGGAMYEYIDDDDYVCFRQPLEDGRDIFWTLHYNGWEAFRDWNDEDEPFYWSKRRPNKEVLDAAASDAVGGEA